MNSRKGFGRYVLDMLFPNRCPFCDKIIRWDKLSCNNCFSDIMWTDEGVCKICGKDVCKCSEELNYDKCYTAAYYKGNVKNAVVALKAHYGINFADIIADTIVYKMIQDEIHKKIDCIIPVPMSDNKLKIRTYNQAEEIAKSIKKLTGICVETKILKKHYRDIDQHELNAEERAENVKDLFYCIDSDKIKGRTVLLCDDVLTTGATINECARLLKENGAEKVVAAIGATTSLII